MIKIVHSSYHYTESEKEAKADAIAAGVPFPASYALPYLVEMIDEEIRKDREWHVPTFRFSWHGEENREYWNEFPKEFYRVVVMAAEPNECHPVTNFFRSFSEARKAAEELNIRHFRVAAMSENKQHPVLI